jgi:hypothetical protein
MSIPQISLYQSFSGALPESHENRILGSAFSLALLLASRRKKAYICLMSENPQGSANVPAG